MPGLNARAVSKNISRSKRAALDKNTRRVAAALADDLELCTYGKVTKACGNKMFMITDIDKKEHVAHIRGKMTRISINDIVLLNIRDYESRSNSDAAVYDIMAVFDTHDVVKLIKNMYIPTWMSGVGDNNTDELSELFDYSHEGTSDSDGEAVNTKKKRRHVMRAAETDTETDAPFDIDAI